MSTIKLKGSSSGEAEVTVAAAAGTPTFTLPTTVGSANQLVKNSGTAGTLEYASNLTYDGSDLAVGAGNLNVSKPAIPTVLVQNSTDTSYSTVKLQQSSGSGGYFAVTKLGTNSSATGGANAAQLWQSGNAPMVFGTNNAERMRIAADGHVSITSGNLEFANGAGVDFSNVPDGSRSIGTDGNKFDDYEEGTFTPVAYKGSTALSPTQAYGHYTKVGRAVHINFYVYKGWDGTGVAPGGTTYWTIQGLPFSFVGANSSGYNFMSGGYISVNSSLSTTGNDRYQINSSGTSIASVYSSNNSTNWTSASIEFSGNGTLWVA